MEVEIDLGPEETGHGSPEVEGSDDIKVWDLSRAEVYGIKVSYRSFYKIILGQIEV
jgi:hypothetical protein